MIAAVKERGVAYGGKRDWRTWVGLALIVYAMLVYPLVGMALGHDGRCRGARGAGANGCPVVPMHDVVEW